MAIADDAVIGDRGKALGGGMCFLHVSLSDGFSLFRAAHGSWLRNKVAIIRRAHVRLPSTGVVVASKVVRAVFAYGMATLK